MRTRTEVARFIESQLETGSITREKNLRHHYGVQELRELLDFIYDGTPSSEGEMLGMAPHNRKDVIVQPFVGPPVKMVPYRKPLERPAAVTANARKAEQMMRDLANDA